MGFWSNLEKSVDQFFEFQPDAYKREITSLNEHQLRARHRQIQRKMVGAATGAGLSAWAAPVTGGLSLLGTGIAVRRLDVNGQRCDLIEARMAEMGWQGNDFGLGDLAWGVAPAGLAHAFVPGADHLIDQAAAHAAAHVAAHHGANQMLEQAATHATVQVAGTHGGHNLVDRVATHVQHMAGDHVAGVDEIIGSTNPVTVQAAHELIYKTTHTAGERLAESTGAWLAHEATGNAVGTTTGFVVGKVSDVVSGSHHVTPSLSNNKSRQSPVQPTREPGQKSASHAKTSGNPLPLKTLKKNAIGGAGSSRSGSASALNSVNFPSRSSKPGMEPSKSAPEAGGSEPAILKTAVFLLPSLTYSLLGEEVFWFTWVCGTLLALRSGSKRRISSFMVLALLPTFLGSSYLWIISISLALLDITGWGILLVVAKGVLFLFMFLLALVMCSYFVNGPQSSGGEIQR